MGPRENFSRFCSTQGKSRNLLLCLRCNVCCCTYFWEKEKYMSTTRRNLGIVLVLLLASCMLFAAGTKEQIPTATEGTETTTLSILDYSDATAPGYEESEAVWQKFMDENPGIVLKKEDLTNEAFHQKLAAYVAAGTIPDVMYMYPSGRSAVLHQKHLVKDLVPLLGSDFLSHFLPAALNTDDQSGHYLAMLPSQSVIPASCTSIRNC